MWCPTFFCSHKYYKIETYFIFELAKKKFGPVTGSSGQIGLTVKKLYISDILQHKLETGHFLIHSYGNFRGGAFKFASSVTYQISENRAVQILNT
jgi:hypothetical protein